MKAIYAATDREVIHAKDAPNLFARMSATIEISKMVGTILNTIDERMKLIAWLPRSIIRFSAPISQLR